MTLLYIIIHEMNKLSLLCYDKDSFIEIIDNSRNYDKFSNLYRNTENRNLLFKIHKDFDLFESNNVYHAIIQNHNKDFVLYELIPLNSDINNQLNIVDEYM